MKENKVSIAAMTNEISGGTDPKNMQPSKKSL